MQRGRRILIAGLMVAGSIGVATGGAVGGSATTGGVTVTATRPRIQVDNGVIYEAVHLAVTSAKRYATSVNLAAFALVLPSGAIVPAQAANSDSAIMYTALCTCYVSATHPVSGDVAFRLLSGIGGTTVQWRPGIVTGPLLRLSIAPK